MQDCIYVMFFGFAVPLAVILLARTIRRWQNTPRRRPGERTPEDERW